MKLLFLTVHFDLRIKSISADCLKHTEEVEKKPF